MTLKSGRDFYWPPLDDIYRLDLVVRIRMKHKWKLCFKIIMLQTDT